MKNTWMAKFALMWAVSGLAGCAAPGFLKISKDDFPKAGPKDPVVRIVGIWQPAMGPGLENKSSRGFSGQILFFGQGDRPVQVDGDVKIYVFDDCGTPEEQAKPISDHNFPAKSWNALLSKGPLGATYGVFIPYIRPGNYEAKCTLRVRYKPANGPVAYSDMVNILLEGKKKPAPDGDSIRDYDEVVQEQRSGGKSTKSRPKEVAFREPPRTYGLAEAIPSLNGSGAARNPRASGGLSEDDRARIIREVRARVAAETNGKIKLVEYEDRDSDVSPAVNSSAPGKRANPREETPAEIEQDESIALPAAVADEAPIPTRRKPVSARRHILDDDDDDETRTSPDERRPGEADQPTLTDESEGYEPPATPHSIDDARQDTLRYEDRGGVQTYTIKLPESLLAGT
jgi:hypothetical protein